MRRSCWRRGGFEPRVLFQPRGRVTEGYFRIFFPVSAFGPASSRLRPQGLAREAPCGPGMSRVQAARAYDALYGTRS
jgi:hypothetical protein